MRHIWKSILFSRRDGSDRYSVLADIESLGLGIGSKKVVSVHPYWRFMLHCDSMLVAVVVQ